MGTRQRGLSLGRMRTEEQNESDLVLSEGAPNHVVVTVVHLLGERTAALLFFRFLLQRGTEGHSWKVGAPWLLR